MRGFTGSSAQSKFSSTSFLELFSLGALTAIIPLAEVERALADTGTSSRRQRLLTAPLVVYYVLALTLFRHDSMAEVFRRLLEGLKVILPFHQFEVAEKSSLSKARTRLGEAPLKLLFERLARPVANEFTRGAFYRDLQLVAIDGSTCDTFDSPENAQAFGYPSASRGETAFPQLRFALLVESGTHIPFACALDRYDVSEIALARRLFASLTTGMLCLADRNFFSFQDWRDAQDHGAQLLWRVKTNLRLPCESLLHDGSYLSRIYPDDKHRRSDSGVTVRVIEYRIENLPDSEPYYRLLTTLLDPETAPAQELAALYHERWEVESVLDEIKTHLRGNWLLLRSKTPELVRQEFYGLLLTHFALRSLMHQAALKADVEPDTVSFIHTVRVMRRTLARFAATPP